MALLAQIASNFANDYFDFKKGADKEDRLGPERAVASGWITPKAMLWGTFITLGLSCLCGCFLFFFAGWELIGVGIAIAICVLAYSAGPFPLAYNGLGDDIFRNKADRPCHNNLLDFREYWKRTVQKFFQSSL